MLQFRGRQQRALVNPAENSGDEPGFCRARVDEEMRPEHPTAAPMVVVLGEIVASWCYASSLVWGQLLPPHSDPQE